MVYKAIEDINLKRAYVKEFPRSFYASNRKTTKIRKCEKIILDKHTKKTAQELTELIKTLDTL